MPNRFYQQLLKRLAKEIEKVMRDPRTDTGAPAMALLGASLLYGGAASLRRKLYRRSMLSTRKLTAPVISVGNLTAGGTGKTPMTIYLARLLQKENYLPAVISRGYGGRAEKKGMIVSDGVTIFTDARYAGDEPIMLAGRLPGVPVIIGQNRYQSAMTAIERYGCNIMILDDGFQHMRLHRDLNIVLMDARQPVGNGHVIPRGMLREPCSALEDADAVVLTRSTDKRSPIPGKIASFLNNIPLFQAGQAAYLHHFHDPREKSGPFRLENLNGKSVFLFSGIAHNDDFYRTVSAMGAKIKGHAAFADHHRYEEIEIADIMTAAVKAEADLLLTTEKDLARMQADAPIPWPLPFAAIGVKMTFHDEAFACFVTRAIKPVA